MPFLGQAVIAIWNDITPEGRANFNEWHPREHMPERVSIPGFRRGRRYIGTDAKIEFFTFYEADNIGVLTGPDYKARLNAPTEWSTRSVAAFRNNLRGVCQVAFTAGHADGAHLATIRFDVKEGRAEGKLRAALSQKILPPLVERPEIVGAHLCIVDKTLSGTNTSLQRTRTIGVPSWIVMIEGAAAAAVRAAADIVASDLPGLGASPEIIDEMYLLEYGLTKQPGAR